MKTFFLLFLTSLFIGSTVAQQITLNDEFAGTKIEDVQFLDQDSYIQAILIENYNQQGAIQWIENNRITKQVIIDNIVDRMRFRVEPSGIRVDVQIHSDCDITMNIFKSILLDTITSDKIRFGHEDAIDIDFKDAYNFGDSVKYYLTYDKTIIKSEVGVENNLVFNVDFFESLLDFKFINDKVFIYGGDTLLSINVYNLDTSLIATNGNYIYDMAEKGEELYVVGSKSLDKYDIKGGKIKSFNFPNESKAYEILIEDERIFIMGKKSENNYDKIVYELIEDETFTEIYSEEYLTINPTNMYWNSYSGLTLIGALEYDTYPVFYGQHGVMIDVERAPNHAPDLELSIENIEAGENETGAYNLEISLRITNQGLDTAKNVHIYSSAFASVWCSTLSFEHLEEEILPGESNVINKTVYPFYTSNTIDREVCFWVNGSDRKFDPEFENHFVCQQVVGIEDLLGLNDGSRLTVSPNPARNILNVDGNFNGSLYKVYTLNGQKVLSGTLENRINIEVLNSGIYFLQILDGKNLRVSKFAKAN